MKKKCKNIKNIWTHIVVENGQLEKQEMNQVTTVMTTQRLALLAGLKKLSDQADSNPSTDILVSQGWQITADQHPVSAGNPSKKKPGSKVVESLKKFCTHPFFFFA